MCGYQKRDSPQSNMKLQWSIQQRHTQLVLSRVTNLNYRNEHIWPPTRKWVHIFEAFHLASLQFITFNHFLYLHLFWDRCLKFFIFQFDEQAFGLWHHTFQYKSFSLFPSQILVYATTFAAHYLFSRFDIAWAKKQKKIEWEEI